MNRGFLAVVLGAAAVTMLAVLGGERTTAARQRDAPTDSAKFLTQPLVKEIYTADPSAHVFGTRLYVYPSHDIEAGVPEDDLGSHFAMRDYRVLSMETVGGPVTVHGVALDIKDVRWAGRQMWAPDAAEKNGKYFLYFPAKDKQDIFRIGVAVASSPTGPFTAEPHAIEDTYSIDPAVFIDTDGRSYMYFGGIWGGQLQRWATGSYVTTDTYPRNDQPALTPKIARLKDDMLGLAETPRNVVILDEHGKPLTAGDNKRRFFEASWMHRYGGTYYFSVLDRRHPLHRLRDRRLTVRAIHVSREGPGTGARLDEPPLDRGVQGEVVPLLSRLPTLGWQDAPAKREGRGGQARARRVDRNN